MKKEIVKNIITFFNPIMPLKDKRILITAGPTYEAIDPVRFIGNHSSGKMGFALAKDNNPPESSGVALGLINTFVVGSGAILQPLVGVFLDYRWTGEMFDGVRVFNLVDFQVSMLILPFVCLISFASAFYIREPQ